VSFRIVKCFHQFIEQFRRNRNVKSDEFSKLPANPRENHEPRERFSRPPIGPSGPVEFAAIFRVVFSFWLM
jgi:hypothetical protein